MASKQAFKTVFKVTNVGSGVTEYATMDKHIAFSECGSFFKAIVSTGFAQDNQWEKIDFTYQQGKLTGNYPGRDRHVVFEYQASSKKLICHMPPKAPGSFETVMAVTGNGSDDDWGGQPN